MQLIRNKRVPKSCISRASWPPSPPTGTQARALWAQGPCGSGILNAIRNAIRGVRRGVWIYKIMSSNLAMGEGSTFSDSSELSQSLSDDEPPVGMLSITNIVSRCSCAERDSKCCAALLTSRSALVPYNIIRLWEPSQHMEQVHRAPAPY